MEAHNSLVLFKRHTNSCAVHKLRMPAARRRYWMDCKCPVWVVGRTPDGKEVPRQSTYCTDAASASAYLTTRLNISIPETAESGLRLDNCIARYIETKRPPEFSLTTYRHNVTWLGSLQKFCESRGVLHIRQLNVDLIEDFKKSIGHSDSTIGQVIKKIRCFLREAFVRGWLTEPLGERVRRHFVGEIEQTAPFTDREIIRLVSTTGMKRGSTGYARHPETFMLLVKLMLETGLRVSDAVLYNPRECVRGSQMWKYQYVPQKTRKKAKGALRQKHEVYLTEPLKLAIDQCSWYSASRPFAFDDRTFAQLGVAVLHRMNAMGERAGIPDCRPHRLRDTFAIRLLTQGVQLDDVSRLLGHASVQVTQAHYAKWVPARANRLEGVVAQTLLQPGQALGSNG